MTTPQQPHVCGEPGAKPFLDKLLLGGGFVGSRAAPSLCSFEHQPLTQVSVVLFLHAPTPRRCAHRRLMVGRSERKCGAQEAAAALFNSSLLWALGCGSVCLPAGAAQRPTGLRARRAGVYGSVGVTRWGEGDRLTLPRLCPRSGSTSPPCVTWRLDWFGQEGATWSISLSGSGRGTPKLVPVLRPLADGWTGGCLDGRLGAEISKSSKAALQWSRWRGRGGVGSGSGGREGRESIPKAFWGHACVHRSLCSNSPLAPSRAPTARAGPDRGERVPPSLQFNRNKDILSEHKPVLGRQRRGCGTRSTRRPGRPEGWQPLCLGGRGGDVRARRGRFQRAADGQIGGP